MTKYAALDAFYNSFGLKAYEENTIPDTAKMPYLTYEVVTDSLSDYPTALTCNLWYKSNSWKEINAKAEEIGHALTAGAKLSCDDGYIMLFSGSPFAQNMPKGDDKTVKGKYMNITAMFITK